MRRLALLTALELRRRLRDPLAALTWIAIPFVLVTLLVLVFGRGSSPLPQVKVLVVDRDGSPLSGFLVSALENPRLAEYFSVRAVDESEAARLMAKGRASLLLVVPERFGEDFLEGRPVRLEAFRNPSETMMPRIAEELVRFLARGGETLRAVLLPLIDLDGFRADPARGEAEVQAVAARIFRLARRPEFRNLLGAAALPVEEHHPRGSERSRSQVVGWFAPGFVVLALLFLAAGQSQELQEDVLAGRLQRALSFPSSPSVPVVARAAALTLSTALAGAMLAALLALLLGWRPGALLPLGLHMAASAAAFSGLALLLRSLTRNPEAGGAATSGVMVGLGFLGGCFVPSVFLPPVLRAAASWVPPGWAVQGFLLLQGSSWAGVPGGLAPRTAALAAFALLTTFLAARTLERRIRL